eukprot:CAMPEP_0113873684 /NCGR_PEP_ID=MMETSP0780_2-20120614/3910_1 /TAXON_ID=652834 /ORGANISM="Palpitomonas bilix" /LENGTH=640 /DNA_ID=CAMNT_0000859363 /DNA_START=660 /DNA_END=2582 /DNA_ORIENTATION=- /assembly_acc=CAM_ASM_000599
MFVVGFSSLHVLCGGGVLVVLIYALWKEYMAYFEVEQLSGSLVYSTPTFYFTFVGILAGIAAVVLLSIIIAIVVGRRLNDIEVGVLRFTLDVVARQRGSVMLPVVCAVVIIVVSALTLAIILFTAVSGPFSAEVRGYEITGVQYAAFACTGMCYLLFVQYLSGLVSAAVGYTLHSAYFDRAMVKIETDTPFMSYSLFASARHVAYYHSGSLLAIGFLRMLFSPLSAPINACIHKAREGKEWSPYSPSSRRGRQYSARARKEKDKRGGTKEGRRAAEWMQTNAGEDGDSDERVAFKTQYRQGRGSIEEVDSKATFASRGEGGVRQPPPSRGTITTARKPTTAPRRERDVHAQRQRKGRTEVAGDGLAPSSSSHWKSVRDAVKTKKYGQHQLHYMEGSKVPQHAVNDASLRRKIEQRQRVEGIDKHLYALSEAVIEASSEEVEGEGVSRAATIDERMMSMAAKVKPRVIVPSLDEVDDENDEELERRVLGAHATTIPTFLPSPAVVDKERARSKQWEERKEKSKVGRKFRRVSVIGHEHDQGGASSEVRPPSEGRRRFSEATMEMTLEDIEEEGSSESSGVGVGANGRGDITRSDGTQAKSQKLRRVIRTITALERWRRAVLDSIQDPLEREVADEEGAKGQ